MIIFLACVKLIKNRVSIVIPKTKAFIRMRKFKYKFTTTVKILLALAVVAGVGCFLINGWRIASLAAAGKSAASDYFAAAFSAFIGILTIVVMTSVIFNSYYTVTDKAFVARYGFFKNTIELSKVTALTRIKREKKSPDDKTKEFDRLELHFNAEDFFVINAKPEEYAELAGELKKKNSAIAYIEDFD